jgi:glycerol-3-phosphate O-acyltransferase
MQPLIYRLLYWLLLPFIRRIRLPEPHVERLQQWMDQGPLIFVVQTASIIDYLILTHVLRRVKLKGIGATFGLSPWMRHGFSKALSLTFNRMGKTMEERSEGDRQAFFEEYFKGQNALIFLKSRYRFFSRKTYYFHGFFGELLTEAERQQHRLIFMPTSIFLSRRRKSPKRTGWEILFGTYDVPSRPRKLWQLLSHINRGHVLFSKPIHLEERNEEFRSLSKDRLDKKLRWTLLLHLNNEDRAYRGPTKRSREHKTRLILRDKRLRQALLELATKDGRNEEGVFKEAEKILMNMASDTNERVMFLLKSLFDYVWHRTLEGVDYNPKELAMIRELSKQGSVVLLPCHRSHVDYLVIAHLFESNGLNPPRFAAGDNLRKWPLGGILRRAGAFFIRRSFKGDAIFPHVFLAYLRMVLRERQNLTFFMEGGRSRTGKLLPPKLGLLTMIFDTWRSDMGKPLPLVPVTVDYGKVFEGQAYLDEKSGAEKKGEGLKSLLATPKFLKRKHGVVRIRISEPLYFDQELQEKGLSLDEITFRNKLPFLNTLSSKIINQINRRVTLTAGNVVALVLMGTPRPAMTYPQLRAQFLLTVRHLRFRQVELAFVDRHSSVAIENALSTFEAWETITQTKLCGETIIAIPKHKRPEMEYYKNNGLHFVLDMALFSAAFQVLKREDRRIERIQEEAEQLFDVLKAEFVLEEGWFTSISWPDLAAIFQRIEGLSSQGDLLGWGLKETGIMTFKGSGRLLLNFLETLFLTADCLLDESFIEDMPQKDFLRQVMAKGELLLTTGTLQQRESLNKITMAQALEDFKKRGFIRLMTGKNFKTILIQRQVEKREAFEAFRNRLFQWMLRLQ